MNRNVYILLTVAVIASVLSVARAETLEERKQRIMRKYMRERQDIIQGDFALPEVAEEDVRVVESEQFKKLAPEFERQQNVTMPRSVQPYQPVPMESERSWWMEAAEMEEDPYANPFSSKADADEDTAESWSPWSPREEEPPVDSGAYGEQLDAQDNPYWRGREDSYGYDNVPGRQWDSRAGTYSGYRRETESRRSSVPGMTYEGYTSGRSPTGQGSDQMSGFYGRQPADRRATDSGWGQSSSVRYGSSTPQGFMPSSLPSPTDTTRWSSQSQTPGYSPYRSPFQDQGNEFPRYGDNLQSQPSQYTRPSNYQKWKDSNKTWDPSSGNLYLDELMRNERR